MPIRKQDGRQGLVACVCVTWLQIVDCMKHDGLIQLLADELLNGKG